MTILYPLSLNYVTTLNVKCETILLWDKRTRSLLLCRTQSVLLLSSTKRLNRPLTGTLLTCLPLSLSPQVFPPFLAAERPVLRRDGVCQPGAHAQVRGKLSFSFRKPKNGPHSSPPLHVLAKQTQPVKECGSGKEKCVCVWGGRGVGVGCNMLPFCTVFSHKPQSQ